MLREHDLHVPSVDTGDETSTADSWTDFLERVDAHDRSLFTEGTGISLANHPKEKPRGIVGRLYDAREGTPVAPVIDSLWTFKGAAPLEAVANRAGLFPEEVEEVVGNGIPGFLQITTVAELDNSVIDNPNVKAIKQRAEEGAIEPDKPVVFSRPLSKFYAKEEQP